jgi:hypothetical protein
MGATVAETVVRELRLDRRHGAAYMPSNARFDTGFMVAEPVEFEVFIPEERLDFERARDHLSTVDHKLFGRYEITVHDWRTDRRRVGVRAVFRDAYAAVMFKLAVDG